MKSRRYASAAVLCAVFLAAAATLAACGRSALDDFSDGAAPADSGVDADAIVPGCSVDADCDDGLFCDGVELCRGSICVEGMAPFCDDGVDCTEDSCVEADRSCQFVPAPDRCPEGTMCDPVLGCEGRECRTSRDCDDRFVCNGAEECLDGFCMPGRPLDCNDGIDCTVDECSEAAGGCSLTPVDLRCDDRLFCNGAERCDVRRGCSPGEPVFCGVTTECSMDRCDERSRTCISAPLDRDRDGFGPPECGGLDCNDRNPLVNPRARELCGDVIDNNCDGLADCVDPLCARSPECAMCTPFEFSCDDRVDEDCDGLIDCADPDCGFDPGCVLCTPELCGSGRDDDCDGLVYCADSDCAADPFCMFCLPESCS
ncbi:MAG: putative metal-binding motif-containing protein, partial [Deltaproteobacteria bacterium]|nr:putative metal-binding motif-containing protein [Deltaproteobacteria bacterium]